MGNWLNFYFQLPGGRLIDFRTWIVESKHTYCSSGYFLNDNGSCWAPIIIYDALDYLLRIPWILWFQIRVVSHFLNSQREEQVLFF